MYDQYWLQCVIGQANSILPPILRESPNKIGAPEVARYLANGAIQDVPMGIWCTSLFAKPSQYGYSKMAGNQYIIQS